MAPFFLFGNRSASEMFCTGERERDAFGKSPIRQRKTSMFHPYATLFTCGQVGLATLTSHSCAGSFTALSRPVEHRPWTSHSRVTTIAGGQLTSRRQGVHPQLSSFLPACLYIFTSTLPTTARHIVLCLLSSSRVGPSSNRGHIFLRRFRAQSSNTPGAACGSSCTFFHCRTKP